MAGEIRTGAENVIRELLRREHGVRKCARILFFMDRRQLVDILLGLPDDIVIAIAREMAKLRAHIPDLLVERQKIGEELGALTEVIDLSPPRPSSNPFDFLGPDDLHAVEGLEELGGRLKST